MTTFESDKILQARWVLPQKLHEVLPSSAVIAKTQHLGILSYQ